MEAAPLHDAHHERVSVTTVWAHVTGGGLIGGVIRRRAWVIDLRRLGERVRAAFGDG